MTELTERGRLEAAILYESNAPDPPSAEAEALADLLRALCDENDQLRDALGELLRAQFDADRRLRIFHAGRSAMIADRRLDEARGRARSALDADSPRLIANGRTRALLGEEKP